MSEVERFLGELERSLPYSDPLRAEVGREARDHLLALVDRYRREGMSQSEAESRALDSFGSIDDFVTRFEAQGGPTTASVPATDGFGILAGSYVGLVIGIAVGFILDSSSPGLWGIALWGLAGLILGALGGRGLILRSNLGLGLGAALGAIVGNVAVANYLSFHSSVSRSDSWFGAIEWATVIGALCGFGIGLVPRLRKDPTPLLWATALGVGGHVIARLWLEDYPTLTSLITLTLGLLLGGALGLHRLARRYVLVPLGGMLGMTSAFLLMFWGVRYVEQLLGVSIFPRHNRAAGLPIGALVGAAIGLAFALRSEPANFRRERSKIDI